MANISVRQAHERDIDELRDLVAGLASDLHSKYQFQSRWVDDTTIEFKRSGVTGELRILETEVVVDLKLGLMASAFKHRIDADLRQAMRDILA